MFIEIGLFYNTELLLCTFNKIDLFSVQYVLRSIKQVVVALYFKIAIPEGFSFIFSNSNKVLAVCTSSLTVQKIRKKKNLI